ncbi:MAG: hypothetical protein ACKN9N_06595, partial [Actinomycetota bacterium]
LPSRSSALLTAAPLRPVQSAYPRGKGSRTPTFMVKHDRNTPDTPLSLHTSTIRHIHSMMSL